MKAEHNENAPYRSVEEYLTVMAKDDYGDELCITAFAGMDYDAHEHNVRHVTRWTSTF